MDQGDAQRALDDAKAVVCLQAAIAEAKEIRDACLEEGIPALLDRAPMCHADGCGCAPKLELLVRPEDVPRVEELLGRRWQGMLEREGTLAVEGAAASGEELPCPACGTAAPLAAGACAGCGLHLA